MSFNLFTHNSCSVRFSSSYPQPSLESRNLDRYSLNTCMFECLVAKVLCQQMVIQRFTRHVPFLPGRKQKGWRRVREESINTHRVRYYNEGRLHASVGTQRREQSTLERRPQGRLHREENTEQ